MAQIKGLDDLLKAKQELKNKLETHEVNLKDNTAVKVFNFFQKKNGVPSLPKNVNNTTLEYGVQTALSVLAKKVSPKLLSGSLIQGAIMSGIGYITPLLIEKIKEQIAKQKK